MNASELDGFCPNPQKLSPTLCLHEHLKTVRISGKKTKKVAKRLLAYHLLKLRINLNGLAVLHDDVNEGGDVVRVEHISNSGFR